jgi:3-hydroxyisobutyrate dehydrogenase-like beta-hydroxyacid dehydrogenase
MSAVSQGAPARIGVIGVGEMGRPMVDRLLAAGHKVAALVRRPEQREELAAKGVEIAPTVADLARGREAVILYVYTDDQVKELAFQDGLLGAAEPGTTIVIHTTGSPKTAEAIAEAARPRGVHVIDAAGSGGPAKVAAGELTLMVGGDAEDFERCRGIFTAYAQHIFHVGPIGAGQALKLVNNALFGAHIQLALEACRVGAEFGLEPKRLAEVLRYCSGGSAVTDILAAMGSPEALVKGAGRFVHKDVSVAMSLADELGADLGLLRTVNAPLLEATKP